MTSKCFELLEKLVNEHIIQIQDIFSDQLLKAFAENPKHVALFNLILLKSLNEEASILETLENQWLIKMEDTGGNAIIADPTPSLESSVISELTELPVKVLVSGGVVQVDV